MPQQGTHTLTTLYVLSNSGVAERFDEFRTKRGLPTYFRDEAGHFEICFPSSIYLDSADLDELDRAFLNGAQAHCTSGIRLPWPIEAEKDYTKHPAYPVVSEYFREYTIWPGKHALIPVNYALVSFMYEFVSHCEQLTR